MNESRPLIAVVDDDVSVRESLPFSLRELGYDADAFASGEEFLDSGRIMDTRCVILDVAMPGMSGPELLGELLASARPIPVVFITGQTDPALRPSLLEQGAVECLLKPFTEVALVAALKAALE